MFLFFQSGIWLGRNIDFKITRFFLKTDFWALDGTWYRMAFYTVSHVVCVKEENWSVKCFIGHTIKLKGDKGPPTIQLKATWKGYEGEQPTMEPWGEMKKPHSRQLKRYVKKHPDLKDAVTTYQLFNKL